MPRASERCGDLRDRPLIAGGAGSIMVVSSRWPGRFADEALPRRWGWAFDGGIGVRTLWATLTSETRKSEPLDTSVRLVTPERVEFRYPLAGPFRRAISYLIDMAVMASLMAVGFFVMTVLTLGTPSGLGLILAFIFFLTWGYGGFCEGFFNGQTVGKRALGIRVMTTEGVPITGSQAALRNLIGVVDGPMGFLYLIGFSSMLLTRRFQRMGDLAAGTMVVVEEPRYSSKVPRVEPEVVQTLLPLLPLRVTSGSEMARALSDYVRHRARFGRDRREEIARHLARPLRERYDLPRHATSDAVLCAFYHRLFLGE
jgi:uncharacterized RDD family membrane protein YckC